MISVKISSTEKHCFCSGETTNDSVLHYSQNYKPCLSVLLKLTDSFTKVATIIWHQLDFLIAI